MPASSQPRRSWADQASGSMLRQLCARGNLSQQANRKSGCIRCLSKLQKRTWTKPALFMGVFWGIAMMLVNVPWQSVSGADIAFNIAVSAVCAAFVGVWWGRLMTRWGNRYQGRAAAEREVASLDLDYTFEMAVDGSAADVFDAIRSTLKSIGVREEVQSDRHSGVLVVKTAASTASWGELITVAVRPMGEQIGIRIHSRPSLSTTIVDGGRNYDNVHRIANSLVERFNVTESLQQTDAPGQQARPPVVSSVILER